VDVGAVDTVFRTVEEMLKHLQAELIRLEGRLEIVRHAGAGTEVAARFATFEVKIVDNTKDVDVTVVERVVTIVDTCIEVSKTRDGTTTCTVVVETSAEVTVPVETEVVCDVMTVVDVEVTGSVTITVDTDVIPSESTNMEVEVVDEVMTEVEVKVIGVVTINVEVDSTSVVTT
jgi:hypothetical protein